MATEILKQEPMIKQILEEVPITREDDNLLYAEIIRRYYSKVSNYGFLYTLCRHKELCIPSFESIMRVRRKVQKKHPELTSEKTKAKRALQEAQYREYAKEG